MTYMKLSDFTRLGEIKRNSNVSLTMNIDSEEPYSLCYMEHQKFTKMINANPNITGVITTVDLSEYVDTSKGLLISENPRLTYFKIHKYFAANFKGLVTKNKISDDVTIADTAIIKQKVEIGKRVVIDDYAIVYEDTIIEDDTYIGPGAIIGARGMQHIRNSEIYGNLPYMGGVHIGKNCEILAYAIIQKPYHAYFTKIDSDTKISVKSSIGHGSKVGFSTTIAGGTTIAGNSKIGNNVWIGPGCVLRDDIRIGNNAKLLMGSILAKNLPDNEVYSSFFALPQSKMLRIQAKMSKNG